MLRVALVEDSREEADALRGHLERYGRAKDIGMTVACFCQRDGVHGCKAGL